uniref:ADF-H domain-containing protein n=1 Tax=Caenorhabditis tropicalis TaxID=1561998 RepID=A0A1I7TM04_9PELO
MTLNYHAHGKEIEASYKRVSADSDGDKWVIFDYEGNSNTIRVGEEGTGGLNEFADSFSSGRLQFGVISVRLSSDVFPKIVLIHWQGEGVPTLRLASTTPHAEEFRRFLKTVHIVLHARSEIDVEPDAIRKEVRKLPAANASTNSESTYSIPEKATSVYQPTNAQSELSSAARENFWSSMNQEEKRRQAEEKTAHAEQLKRYEADRERTMAEIHTKAENYQPEKVNSVYKPTKPHVEMKSVNREEFWSKMNEEEKLRQEEEKIAREQAHKQFEADRQRMASEIHTKAENYQPDKVTSVYKPTKPHVEISSSAREEFWNKMNEEEKKRQAEEKEAHELKQKEFENDRKRVANDIHEKLQLNEKTVPTASASSHVSNTISSSSVAASSGLVGSRKEMFNAKPSDPILPKPTVNGGGAVKKWPPVGANQTSEPREPVNRITESQPEEPVAYKPEPFVYKPEPMKPVAPAYDAYEEPPAEPAPIVRSPVSPPSFIAPTPVVAPPPPEPTPAYTPSQYDSPPVFEPYETSRAPAPTYQPSQYDAPPVQEPEPTPTHYQSQYNDPPEPAGSYVTRGETSQLPAHIASQYDMPPVLPDQQAPTSKVIESSVPAPQIDQYDFPPSVAEQQAMALWDYQAADDTEISFDPDDIITDIDQVDSGWWKGRAPNGRVGLFPSNYVKLI